MNSAPMGQPWSRMRRLRSAWMVPVVPVHVAGERELIARPVGFDDGQGVLVSRQGGQHRAERDGGGLLADEQVLPEGRAVRVPCGLVKATSWPGPSPRLPPGVAFDASISILVRCGPLFRAAAIRHLTGRPSRLSSVQAGLVRVVEHFVPPSWSQRVVDVIPFSWARGLSVTRAPEAACDTRAAVIRRGLAQR
jgi:hypothetical protein